MRKAQKPDFLRMMYKMANIYGKEINQDMIDIYWEILKGYQIFDVGVAFIEAIKEHKYFPKPAQILPLCSKSIKDYPTLESRVRYMEIRGDKKLLPGQSGENDVKKIR